MVPFNVKICHDLQDWYRKNVQLAAFPVEMVNSSHVDGSGWIWILNLIGFHFDAQAERRGWSHGRGMAKQWGAKGTMQT